MEDVLKYLNKIKNGTPLTIVVLELLKSSIHNFIAGLLKLLH
jgi:hypothetical protein